MYRMGRMRERKAFMNYGSPKRHDGRIEEAKYYKQQAEQSALSDEEQDMEDTAEDILEQSDE